ncbi:hypothetical protein [Mesorhizobium sp. 113-3-9]|uniref:hypothetical protein n=1 Tax=Mesorhizobium sp. 113-3-9 TaxID=2744517 RepID=UPI00192922DF|nr:hypothetical protein [Mesorhizobium sp. 113-3-9]
MALAAADLDHGLPACRYNGRAHRQDGGRGNDKAVARIGEGMVIGGFLSYRAFWDRGRAMGRPCGQFPLLLWQRHQDLPSMTKL